MLTRYVSPALTGLVGIGLALVIWALNGKYRVSVREVLAGIATGFELVIVLAILILPYRSSGAIVPNDGIEQ